MQWIVRAPALLLGTTTLGTKFYDTQRLRMCQFLGNSILQYIFHTF